MKIVYITNIPSPFQIEWAKHMSLSYDVEFWFMCKIGERGLEKPAYWNIELPDCCKMVQKPTGLLGKIFGVSLKEKLDEFQPDVVMLGGAWHMPSFYHGYRWARTNDKKLMAGPIEFSATMYRKSIVLRNHIVYNWVYGKVDLWMANGYIHHDYLTLVLGRKSRIFMNFDNYEPYLQHTQRSTSEIKFFYAGAISRRLRVPEMLKAFESVAKTHKNTSLTIGGFGAEKEDCIRLVSESEILRDRVIFRDVNSWKEIPSLFQECNVLINFASYSPGSGVVLSAVASGMPVISTVAIHATRHFVIDAYNGYLVYDERTLIAAMEKYLDDPDLIILHGKRSRSIANETLTFSKHIRDFSELIEVL